MRQAISIVAFVLGCGGSDLTSVKPAPRPTPAEGGFQARQPAVEGWVHLGAPVEVTPLQRNVQVSGQGGQIAQLLIKGVSGEPEISQIQVEYADKGIKRIDINRRFVPGDGQVIELQESRPIEKIMIFMDPDSGGTFEIFGA